MKLFGKALPVFLGLFLLFGCGDAPRSDRHLLVGSAVSLRPVLEPAISSFSRQHPEIDITVSYAGSGTIRQQIQFGAPIDLYLSASTDHMDSLESHTLIDAATRTVLASNRLILVVSVQRAPIGGLQDLKLPGVTRIAIGNPDVVPAGRYAFQALTRSGLITSLEKKLLYTKDVQQVLVYVRTEGVDAGVVYASDVQASTPVRAIEPIADSLHDPIRYEGAVLRRSAASDAAGLFLAYLSSDSVKTLFRAHAFLNVTS